MQLVIFYKKQLCIFFLQIDSPFYSVHKNMKILLLLTNEYLTKYFLYYIKIETEKNIS